MENSDAKMNLNSVRKPQNLVFKFSPRISKRLSRVELERGNDMVKNVERIY